MGYPTISVPSSPAVPALPGVPPLSRINQFTGNVNAVVGIITKITDLFAGPQWGIFKDDTPVLIGDAVVGFDYRAERRPAEFPIEDGGFSSYNKVQEPYEGKVSITVGGSNQDRATFMTDAEAILASLELYTIATPEFLYSNVNVSHIDYRRESRRGVTLLTIDFWCQEIRIVAAGEFTDSKEASGADPQNGGTVQPANSPAGSQTGNTHGGLRSENSGTTPNTNQTNGFRSENTGLSPAGSPPTTSVATPSLPPPPQPGPAFPGEVTTAPGGYSVPPSPTAPEAIPAPLNSPFVFGV